MRKHLFVTLAAVMALGLTAGTASAACSIKHPYVASYFKVSVVQAFVSCGNLGGNSPNVTTEGGIPACTPPVTFDEQAGSPVDGWRFHTAVGKGTLNMTPRTYPACVKQGTTLSAACADNPLNPVGDTDDLRVNLDLRHIIADDSPGGASGTGALMIYLRATLMDRASGPMTLVDFPASFPFTLLLGSVSLRTSVDALLNMIGQPGLPHCSSLEVMWISVLDENGNAFGNMGAFLR